MPHGTPLIDPIRPDEPFSTAEFQDVRGMPAAQQPDWAAHESLPDVVKQLTDAPALVDGDEIRRFGLLLEAVARGEALVLQAGDCAEHPAECVPEHVLRKTRMLGVLAEALAAAGYKPVVRVGRIAGQFAKPRSKPAERVGGVELPVFRGHLVNGPAPDPGERLHDPRRMLDCHRAARAALDVLREQAGPDLLRTWTSHEALVLDYELPLLRGERNGRLILSSTHWPWIGERTRQVQGAHVQLLSAVANPVACKIGPTTSLDELREVCRRLDPGRRLGRLTLIARLGADRVERLLPRFVDAVRRAGHPVIWLCDPMHGNTQADAAGRKTRLVEDIRREVEQFQRAVTAAGGVAGGLHLEATPDDVRECVSARTDISPIGGNYTSLCDPRLNLRQAIEVIGAWRG